MRTLSLLLVAGFIFWGCESKTNKIEVVPNLETIYTSVNDVDTPPVEPEELNKKMTDSFISAAEGLYDKNSGQSERFKIAVRIYINEKGTVDKIKDISKPAGTIDAGTDSVKDYTDSQRLVSALAGYISGWKFGPAKVNGSPVKCWSDIKVNILMKPDGTHSIELPDFLDNTSLFNPHDNYLVSAEQMPQLVGGIMSLQEKIRYPEIAKRAGIQGKVYILAYIDEKGNVADARVIKGIGAGCDQAALNAVIMSKFIPGRKEGKPVKVQVSIPVIFRLSDKK